MKVFEKSIKKLIDIGLVPTRTWSTSPWESVLLRGARSEGKW